jgi:GMP reductase
MKKFDLTDVLLVPADPTPISSRSEIDPLDSQGMLPLITAPMDTVISKKNWEKFYNAGITPCLPRGIKWGAVQSLELIKKESPVFVSYSLSDVELPNFTPICQYICIDIANGHMTRLHDAVRTLKRKWGDSLTIMTGNVATARGYQILSEAGADLVRIGIGVGNACLTTKQTSIGYPIGSLIKECREMKTKKGLKSLIVADGGMKDYSDVIKALGLGADRVMIGSLFNFAIESAGDNYLWGIKISHKVAGFCFDMGLPVYKKYRGMSTKEVQRAWGKKVLKTSEGIVTRRQVKYRLSGWCDNFRGYLTSAMSYCGAAKLKDFIGEARYVKIPHSYFRRFDK